MNRYLILTALSMIMAFASCTKHMDLPDTSTKIGDVLCTDGSVVPQNKCTSNGLVPIAVVFHLCDPETEEGTAYAVYLDDLSPVAFADSIGIKQNTSADILERDGNANTYAIFSTAAIGSPMADAVFSMWRYGQSAYVPSVAQMQLMYASKEYVNVCLKKCGGTPLSDSPDDCWYWTSTEVSGQETAKAWLYSIVTGARQETPKDESHKVRPVVTIY